MSRAYEDSHYSARTLAITLLDLQPEQRTEILRYLQQQLERLTHAPDGNQSNPGEAQTETSWVIDEVSPTNNVIGNWCPYRRIS